MQGLVLTAGGARGAYQAGVLKRVGEIPGIRDQASPFAIVAGASAGAINGSVLAASGRSFRETTREMARLWSELEVRQVFRTDTVALGLGALALVRDFGLGVLFGGAGARSIFDASPLRALVRRVLPARGIAAAIRRGDLYAVAISATSYHSGRSFTFVQGRPGHPVWVKTRRVVLPVTLTADHVTASAAIPIVFPPVKLPALEGELFFGDGGLRLVTPFSPAIRLGADRIFAVGIRSSEAAETLRRDELGERAQEISSPPLAQICGVFMNAIFLDHLDADLEHLLRMNALIRAWRGGDGTHADVAEPMRVVEPLVVSPSEDLALIAQLHAQRMPRLVRHLLDGLGRPDASSADLMSYLLFDRAYTRALVDVGYRDAAARSDEIEAFLRAGRARRAVGDAGASATPAA